MLNEEVLSKQQKLLLNTKVALPLILGLLSVTTNGSLFSLLSVVSNVRSDFTKFFKNSVIL